MHHFYSFLTNLQQVYGNTLILHLRKKSSRNEKSGDKVMMIISFDHKNVIYKHNVPPKATLNDVYYSFENFATTRIEKMP